MFYPKDPTPSELDYPESTMNEYAGWKLEDDKLNYLMSFVQGDHPSWALPWHERLSVSCTNIFNILIDFNPCLIWLI